MNKKLIIDSVVVLVVIGAIILGYFYYQSRQDGKDAETNILTRASSATEDLSAKSSKGVLPSINPQSNPVEAEPDINPVSKTNPFSNIKTNPFQ